MQIQKLQIMNGEYCYVSIVTNMVDGSVAKHLNFFEGMGVQKYGEKRGQKRGQGHFEIQSEIVLFRSIFEFKPK